MHMRDRMEKSKDPYCQIQISLHCKIDTGRVVKERRWVGDYLYFAQVTRNESCITGKQERVRVWPG
jgi:hypothetical protein